MLLASLRPELRPGDQLIVVDDSSSDDTADVASRGGASVVNAPPLPDGWTGKAWACATGAAASTTDTLVFLDADVSVEPGGLDRIVGAHPGGLLSVQPFHVTVRPYERLSLFFNIVAMMGTEAFTPLGSRRRPSGAFGPCLVTRRDDYEAVGGHASVKSAVLDDVELARRYLASGRPVVCLGGKGTLSFRMYPHGLRQLIEGWSKNIAGGTGKTRVLAVLLVVLWIALCLQAPWLGWQFYAAVVVQLAWMARRIGRFGVLALVLYPIPLLAFLAIYVRSIYLTYVRKRVSWRGRDLNPLA
ncbi:MAG: 4,4-diaponeurosporenoate glycosyltransferase [Acidimicrobiaceae bacterium]|jgi:4,4'-diaponeurosporenoate glycosyltransferase